MAQLVRKFIKDLAVDNSKIDNGTIEGGKLSSTIAIPANATASTQSPGNNSTKLATTAYVEAAVGAIVDANEISRSEKFTLGAGDITAQYVDLAVEVPQNSSISLVVLGGLEQEQGVDYTLSVVASKTRVTFAGDLATAGAAALVATDKIVVKYSY